jgi:hypothetical protein
MKFPILVKHKRVFLWYSGHWININLMSLTNGGGIRGYYRVFKDLLLCNFGKHRYGGVFRMKEMRSAIQCAYCRKEKEIEKDPMV